jgi:hypothetical protein
MSIPLYDVTFFFTIVTSTPLYVSLNFWVYCILFSSCVFLASKMCYLSFDFWFLTLWSSLSFCFLLWNCYDFANVLSLIWLCGFSHFAIAIMTFVMHINWWFVLYSYKVYLSSKLFFCIVFSHYSFSSFFNELFIDICHCHCLLQRFGKIDQFDWSLMFDAFVMLIQALQEFIEFLKYHLQLFDASHIAPSITLFKNLLKSTMTRSRIFCWQLEMN